MSSSSNANSGLGHVDQIREIIVGEQIRQFDARIEALEGRFSDRIESVQKELAKADAARDKAFAKRIEKLETRLKEERAERLEATKAVSKDLSTALKRMTSLSTDGATETRKALDDLHKRLSGEIESLTVLVEKQGTAISSVVDDRTGSLDRVKLDRASLADLLVGLSDKLRDNGTS